MLLKIIALYKKCKARLIEILNDTKAEYSFNIPDVSSFTKEQKIAFNQMIDFFADMIEKYRNKIPKGEAESKKKTA